MQRTQLMAKHQKNPLKSNARLDSVCTIASADVQQQIFKWKAVVAVLMIVAVHNALHLECNSKKKSTDYVCLHIHGSYLFIYYSGLYLNILIELSIAKTATPTSANTACHILAIPNAPRINTANLIPSAKTIFCFTIFIVL